MSENINYILKQMDGGMFVISEGDKPKKQGYTNEGNNALISEQYFIDIRKWESSKIKYECHPSQIGEFVKLVSPLGQYSLSELNEDLAEGILLNSDNVRIESGFAFVTKGELYNKEQVILIIRKMLQEEGITYDYVREWLDERLPEHKQEIDNLK